MKIIYTHRLVYGVVSHFLAYHSSSLLVGRDARTLGKCWAGSAGVLSDVGAA